MLSVIPVLATGDKYMYMVFDEEQKSGAAVDPLDPQKLIELARKEGLTLTAILTTHHHWYVAVLPTSASKSDKKAVVRLQG